MKYPRCAGQHHVVRRCALRATKNVFFLLPVHPRVGLLRIDESIERGDLHILRAAFRGRLFEQEPVGVREAGTVHVHHAVPSDHAVGRKIHEGTLHLEDPHLHHVRNQPCRVVGTFMTSKDGRDHWHVIVSSFVIREDREEMLDCAAVARVDS